MAQVSGISHGGGAGNDPLSAQQMPQNMNIPNVPASTGTASNENEYDLSLSDTPPSASMEKRRRASSAPGAKSSKPGSRLTLRASSLAQRRAGSGRPPSMAAARRARDQSPAPERVSLPDPARVTPAPGAGGTEEMLHKVIEQQRMDHEFLQQVAQAVRTLGSAAVDEQSKRSKSIEEVCQMNVELRREVYAIRGQISQKIEAEILGGTAAIFGPSGPGQALAWKHEELQNAFAKLQVHVATLTSQEEQVEQYLKGMQQQKPQDGQIIEEFVRQEVGQVREMVKRFEPGTALNMGNQQVIPFTQTMSNYLKEIEESVKGHDMQLQQHQRGFNDMVMAVNAIQVDNGSHAQRLLAVEFKANETAERLEASRPPRAERLNLTAAFAGAAAPDAACGAGCGCSADGAGGAGEYNAQSSWQGPSPPGIPGFHGTVPSGVPSGGPGIPLPILQKLTGGNGQCHCVHLEELKVKVAVLEARTSGAGGSRGPGNAAPGGDPWWSASVTAPASATAPTQRSTPLPLDLKGPLGAISYKDRSVFDEKLAMQEDYRFSGTKGGLAWKGKVERHMIGRAPILKEILEWAESCELKEIDIDTFELAVSKKVNPEQALMLNAALWGFLSAAISGTAETIFKGAKTLNGIDAWRRLARFIDHGKAIRLETLRQEVKMLHTKSIASLDKVEEGVAAWENVHQEYALAGGTLPEDPEMKADLLAVLPSEIRETLLWKTTEEAVSYQQFRDHVLTQAGRVLMNRRKLPVHAVEEEAHEDSDGNSLEDLLAALQHAAQTGDGQAIAAVIQKFQRRSAGGRFQPRRQGGDGGGQPPRQSPAGQPRQSPAGDRPPRKCPNCGKTHAGRCTAPTVSTSDRPCWTCGKLGHLSKDCSERKQGGGLKAIMDGQRGDRSDIQVIFNVDDEDFQTVRRGGKPARNRPMPTQATLGDFIVSNSFAALSDPLGSGARSRVPAEEPVPAKPPQESKPPQVNGEHAGRVWERRPCPAMAARSEPVNDEHAGCVGRSGGPCSHGSMGDLRRALAEAQRQADARIQVDIENGIQLLEDEESDAMLAAVAERVTIRPAMDSGSVANVVHPQHIPGDVEVKPNTTGNNFTGAGGSSIERYGTCKTLLESDHGAVGCNWDVADVTRPLHSVSQVTGPADKPAKTNVLFSNTTCVVVPPGIVEEILKHVKPIAEYKREGNLYIAEMSMSAFGRRGQKE